MEAQAIVTDDMIRVLAKTFPASWQPCGAAVRSGRWRSRRV